MGEDELWYGVELCTAVEEYRWRGVKLHTVGEG